VAAELQAAIKALTLEGLQQRQQQDVQVTPQAAAFQALVAPHKQQPAASKQAEARTAAIKQQQQGAEVFAASPASATMLTALSGAAI
jgi:hypothetical protein